MTLDGTKLAAARLWAVTRLPYLARAVFACPLRAAPDTGTVAIDRSWTVHADPAVVERLSADQLGRLLLHLVGHAVRDHAARAEAGAYDDRVRWNRCADAEINDDLAVDDCVPEVAGELPADLGCEPGGLAEAYYAAAGGEPRRWDCGSGADSSPRPWDGGRPDGPVLSGAQAGLLRLAVAADVQREYARDPGSVAGGWQRWAEAVLPSRIDWRRVLAAQLRTAIAAVSGSVDYSYRRPSRRGSVSPDVLLPVLVRPVPEVAVVCDTSGSMHEQLLARALAEVEGLLVRAGLRAGQLRVLAVDTAVHAVRRVSRAAQVELAGGGGTDMGAGIAAAAALRPRPSVIVVLTDGFTPWPDRPPPGVRVVVGLLAEGDRPPGWSPPAWARTVVIDGP